MSHKNGISLGWSSLIGLVLAIGACVAAFTTIGATAKENKADISELKIELKVYAKETTEAVQGIRLEQAITSTQISAMAKKMGVHIDPNN